MSNFSPGPLKSSWATAWRHRLGRGVIQVINSMHTNITVVTKIGLVEKINVAIIVGVKGGRRKAVILVPGGKIGRSEVCTDKAFPKPIPPVVKSGQTLLWLLKGSSWGGKAFRYHACKALRRGVSIVVIVMTVDVLWWPFRRTVLG